MHTVAVAPMPRRVALLAINLLFLMLWGFASVSKLQSGRPSWFPDKFGPTFLATFPDLTATFWILALCELLVFLLAIMALCRLEFLERRPATVLSWMLAGSLLVFVQLGFGQWLTKDFNSAAQLFNYFAGTLLALFFVQPPCAGSARASDV